MLDGMKDPTVKSKSKSENEESTVRKAEEGTDEADRTDPRGKAAKTDDEEGKAEEEQDSDEAMAYTREELEEVARVVAQLHKLIDKCAQHYFNGNRTHARGCIRQNARAALEKLHIRAEADSEEEKDAISNDMMLMLLDFHDKKYDERDVAEDATIEADVQVCKD